MMHKALSLNLIAFFTIIFSSVNVMPMEAVILVLSKKRKPLSEFVPQLPQLKKSKEDCGSDGENSNKVSNDQWGRQVVSLVSSTKNDEEFSALLTYMREYLSYFPWGQEWLDTFAAHCKESQKDLEAALAQRSTVLYTWPHQSAFEALMGHLFFPVQFECLYELPQELHLREHLQNLLALSSSYKNTLAQRHVLEIIPLFIDEPSDQEEEEVQSSEKKRKRKESPEEKFLGPEAHGYLEDYTSQQGSSKPIPAHLGGLLNLMESQYEGAQRCFKRGIELKDAWSMYRYYQGLTNEEEKAAVYSQLKSVCPAFCSLIDGENFSFSQDDRLRSFDEAGEAGIVGAFNSAAILCKQDESLQEKAFDYYARAAQCHLLGAYDEVACILLEDGDKEEAKKAYEFKAQWGDLDGYVKLGQIQLEEDDTVAAVASLKKAGLAGLPALILHAAQGNGDVNSLETLREEETAEKKTRVSRLLKRLKGEDANQ